MQGRSASIPLKVPASTRTRLEAAGRTGTERVLVSVEDIEGERDPGLVYAVFLNLPEDADDADRQSHHIGNVSFFGIGLMNDPDEPHREGAPSLRHTFDATDAVSTLNERGRWDPESVRVTFEPVRLLPPPGQEASWKDEAAEQPSPPVKIGRVSVFIA